jgi:cytochrome P450
MFDKPATTLHPPARKTFPGPRGSWLGGCLHRMRRDPLGLYSQARQDYGDYVRLRVVPGVHCYLLTHPDAVEHVLYKQHQNYRKPDIFYNSVGLLVGNGLFTNEGESWRRQRQLAQPAFHSNYLATLSPLIVQAAEAFVRQRQADAAHPIDMVDGMMKLGLRISSTTLFSADVSGDADAIGKAYRTAFAHISRRLNSFQLIPNWFPTKSNRSFARAKKVLDRAVAELIAQRRANSNPPDDLLAMLLNARDEQTGKPMPRRQLMDEVLTLLTAGHENIGAALSWTWYLLAKHPDVQNDVYDQVHGQLHGRSPSFDDLPRLGLLKAVFEEAMRLYPPGWGELRQSISADQINGFPIPPKAIIILCQWVTHRHPDFWPDPERFDPGRFLPSSAGKQHRFAYFPFGGGPRICIGMQFALAEGSLVLATILQHFRVQLIPDHPVEPDATFTLRPKHGLKVILHPRRSAVS